MRNIIHLLTNYNNKYILKRQKSLFNIIRVRLVRLGAGFKAVEVNSLIDFLETVDAAEEYG